MDAHPLPFEFVPRWADLYEPLLSGDPILVAEAVALLEARDRALEDFLCRVKRPQVWNLNGPLTVSEGDPWTVDSPFTPGLFVCQLKASGSTTTTAELRLNSTTTLATVSLGASVYGPVTAEVDLARDGDLVLEPFTDWLTVRVTAAGSGAQGLVASVYGR